MLILFKRFLRKTAPAAKASTEAQLEPEQYIALIKQGDEMLREQFIAEYSPYIAKVTSRFSKRYINPERDDEFSVALQAFNEAIDGFDYKAGRSFLGFAKTVMQRRLIDYVRKEHRHLKSVPYSSFDIEGEEQTAYNVLETMQALDAHETSRIDQERRSEIMDLNEELGMYGISMEELVGQSPKHTDSRVMLIGIACKLADTPEWMDILTATQRLPIKEVMEACGVSRKTIERNRKYIIAIAIIRSGSYPYMNDYLRIRENDEWKSKEVSR
ncbi:RNA polymerase sigma factor SigI [Paenibacillus sp. strain BS8-2]